MNYMLILNLLGKMLRAQVAFLLFPLLISFAYGGEDATAFLLTIGIVVCLCLPLSFVKPKSKSYQPKDALAAVTLAWLTFSLLGALPFLFAGVLPGFYDCLFESVSGFTTTGATTSADPASFPAGIQVWRALSHWIGGTGVLVLMLAILPGMNASAVNLFRAESTGPSHNRMLPKLRETAKLMYSIYISMTAALFVSLLLTGLPFFDTLIHSFSIAGTGGLSDVTGGIDSFGNPAAEIVMIVFMFLFSISFSLYFCLIRRNFKQFYKDEELRLYVALVVVSITVITINIAGQYTSIGEALRTSSFQVVSIVSTTGLSTADHTLWPALSQAVLLLLMITGGCAGSTSGGMKISRILLLIKTVRGELYKAVHPQSVKVVTINGKKVENDTAVKLSVFLFLYFAVGIVAIALISIEGGDILTNVTSVISMLSNVGPGLGATGPAGNYAAFSSFSKVVLSLCMIAGRLEFMPVFVLLVPSFWKKN